MIMVRKKMFVAGIPVIVLLVIATAVFGRKVIVYQEYRYPNEKFYGKELYSEITYNCSDREKEIGKMLLDQTVKISQYKDTEQEAGMNLGMWVRSGNIIYFKIKKR